jgi:hypothetical protein
LGATSPWEYEVGLNTELPQSQNSNHLDMFENPNNVIHFIYFNPKFSFCQNISYLYMKPIFSRNDTQTAFQWRIRNMIYPIDNYIIELNDDKNSIMVKTKNKK